MDLSFTQEQDILRETVRKFVETECASDKVRAIMDSPDGHDRALWAKIAEQGWCALVVPETHGGLGLELVDLAILFEEMGRGPLPGPFFAHTVGTLAVAHGDQETLQAELLPAFAEGAKIATLAAGGAVRATAEGNRFIVNGRIPQVLDAGAADVLVVAATLAQSTEGATETLLLAVDRHAEGVHTTALKSMDRTRRQYAVELHGARVGAHRLVARGRAAHRAIEAAQLRGALGLAAEMAGGMSWVLETTAEYAKTRRQFDKPIGSFQAIKHPLANLFVDLEAVRSLTLYAAWALDHAPEEARAAVAMAKSHANECAPRAAATGIQLHGGIGFTWEHDLHLFFKRAKVSALQMGGTTSEREALAREIGL